MGKVIICLGLILKVLQILGAASSIETLSASYITVATTSLLVGGFAVFAVEKLNLTSVFAVVCAVCTVAMIMPFKNADTLFYFMCACLASIGLMLISMKKKGRVISGSAVILLTALLAVHNFSSEVNLPAAVITIVLIAIYTLGGIGLFL